MSYNLDSKIAIMLAQKNNYALMKVSDYEKEKANIKVDKVIQVGGNANDTNRFETFENVANSGHSEVTYKILNKSETMNVKTYVSIVGTGASTPNSSGIFMEDVSDTVIDNKDGTYYFTTKTTVSVGIKFSLLCVYEGFQSNIENEMFAGGGN